MASCPCIQTLIDLILKQWKTSYAAAKVLDLSKITSYLILKSSFDVHNLRSTNETFNESLITIILITSWYDRKLSEIIEHLGRKYARLRTTVEYRLYIA